MQHIMRDRLLGLTPALAAIAYPFLLQGFHAAVSGTVEGRALGLAPLLLLAALLMPVWGLAVALHSSRWAELSHVQLRTRRLALLCVAAPPLFVFIAFLLSVLHSPLPDTGVWVVLWAAAALWAWGRRGGGGAVVATSPAARVRVLHGAVAAIVLLYIGFHLTNHLFGLLGPDAHADIMKMGRKVYRNPLIEPVLIGLLLFQVASGGWLAWRWSAHAIDRYRIFQVASGVYLWFFILTHMNSALVSARLIHQTPTDWNWASGAPVGLIHDAWSVRLLPHYALGVFFVLSHLASGLRGVLLAHGASPAVINRAWVGGLVLSGLVSAAIVGALCGLRVGTG